MVLGAFQTSRFHLTVCRTVIEVITVITLCSSGSFFERVYNYSHIAAFADVIYVHGIFCVFSDLHHEDGERKFRFPLGQLCNFYYGHTLFCEVRFDILNRSGRKETLDNHFEGTVRWGRISVAGRIGDSAGLFCLGRNELSPFEFLWVQYWIGQGKITFNSPILTANSSLARAFSLMRASS
ncbi:hypothetical protein TNCV_215251 [Trichonephila clavipes]|nr:hypothetical protein TNCV_215251 [Trichonephila clavipes]